MVDLHLDLVADTIMGVLGGVVEEHLLTVPLDDLCREIVTRLSRNETPPVTIDRVDLVFNPLLRGQTRLEGRQECEGHPGLGGPPVDTRLEQVHRRLLLTSVVAVEEVPIGTGLIVVPRGRSWLRSILFFRLVELRASFRLYEKQSGEAYCQGQHFHLIYYSNI
jgi:hypothetical protein